MKKLFLSFFTLLSVTAWAQDKTATVSKPVKHDNYKPHAFLATLSFGDIDPYRHNYSLPSGFEKNNTTGFPPVYAKLEYGFWKHFSLAATFGYDAVVYNFNQLYLGLNNETIRRYKTDDLRIFGGGVTAFYHIGQYIHVRRLDPFIGVGLALNNIRYSGYPQGDSMAVKTDHSVTPYLKAGARYYISDKISLYGDVGYDKQSIFSLGVSCRFYTHRQHQEASEQSKKKRIDISRLTIDDEAFVMPSVCGICDSSITLRELCSSIANDIVLENKRPAENNDNDLTDELHKISAPILFELNKTEIKKESLPVIEDAIKMLNRYGASYVIIDGYTDTTGKPAYNITLSLKRAEAVKRLLAQKGIEANRIKIKGHGSKSPAGDNKTKEGRMQNRRAVMTLIAA